MIKSIIDKQYTNKKNVDVINVQFIFEVIT